MEAPRNLGGRYEVGELIGRGGMAEVHIGHDTRLGRTVAIKILRSDLARDPSFQARFRREAQAAASLNHPAVVAVYDTGEDVFTEPGGGVAHVPFIVMEYVEGHTVRDILRDGSAVPIEEAVEITTGVLSALEYSHHAGIVHRDIKPANVMLTPTGAVKVMDFGIARAMADAAGTMTQTQAVIGTAQYLSPEQARGEAVDSRSDLYSTGCLLFELLTGRPPFIGDSPVAVAYQHAREEAPAPSTFASDVPEALDRITVKALAKERGDRYSSAAEFRADLEAAIRGGQVGAPAVGATGAAAAAAAQDATAVYADPPTAATQVIGAGTSPTQVVPPGGMPWAQVADHGTGPSTAQQRVLTTDDDEEEPSRRWLVWVLVAVAVLAIGGIAALLLNQPDEPEPVVLDDLTGMTSQEARDWLEDRDLEYRPVQEQSPDVERDRVISTDPPAGETVSPGDAVTVVISSGPDAIAVPDLSLMTQEQAKQRLEDDGFTGDVTIRYEESPDVPEDRVIGSEPPTGESVAPDTAFVLVLSNGQVILPDDLVGRTQDEVTAALSELGLRADVSERPSEEHAPGTVIEIGRSPGPVEQGATIPIVVATEPEPEEVTVPNLTGLTYDQAAAELGAIGLNANRVDVNHPTIAPDQVVDSNPARGERVLEGSTVDVRVSVGPEEEEPPPPGDGED